MELRIVLAMLGGAVIWMISAVIAYVLGEAWTEEDEDSDEPDEEERRNEHE